MKKKLSIILGVAAFVLPLISCEKPMCIHTYYEGICSICGETDAKYVPAEDSNPIKEEACLHTYYDGVCSICGEVDTKYVPAEDRNPKPEPTPTVKGKHLILDEKGNYGGSLNRTKYGEGAPLNGLYDVENDEYYTVNDFYNMKSTDQRTIYTNFAPYQQTMQDSSGLATAVAILNYFGEDVTVYNELELLKRYESLNNTTVYGNGTTREGLVKLFTNLGYAAKADTFVSSGSSRQEYVGAFRDWIWDELCKGNMIIVRYQDNMDSRWRVIIGYDKMGTADWNTDDVVIFADPYDGFDHYQDGYAIEGAGRFERWWQLLDKAGNTSNKYEYISVSPKTPITIERVENDPTEIAPENVPENHLIRNADGSYGGTTDEKKYGAGTPLNGAYDHTDRNYHKFVDYYNMTSTETRTILTNYRAFAQTMASSCGICSTFSVLMYYGYDINVYNELSLVEKYEKVNNSSIKGSGVGSSGLKTMLTSYGFKGVIADSYGRDNYKDESSMNFATYDIFAKFVLGNLSKGTPIPISWRPHGGHWEVIIGYDDMGTEYIYDDVLVLADSGDSWDHYQEGYNTYPATLFYRQWYNGSFTWNQQYISFDKQEI